MARAVAQLVAVLAASSSPAVWARLGSGGGADPSATNATNATAAEEEIGVARAEQAPPAAPPMPAANASREVGVVVPENATGAELEERFEEDFRRAETALLSSAFAKGGEARSLNYWANMTVNTAVEVDASMLMGNEYLATTTRYGNTCCAACGSMDTSALVAGTDYYAVASAQAMQNYFSAGSCCWCGQAGSACGHGTGTAPMGCANCAKGRFIRKLPYSQPIWGGEALFAKEINIVVADICPHKGNEAWCPQNEGEKNHFGSKNHFDFSSPPPGYDNYYFAFTPVPCSAEIEQRLNRLSQCRRR